LSSPSSSSRATTNARAFLQPPQSSLPTVAASSRRKPSRSNSTYPTLSSSTRPRPQRPTEPSTASCSQRWSWSLPSPDYLTASSQSLTRMASIHWNPSPVSRTHHLPPLGGHAREVFDCTGEGEAVGGKRWIPKCGLRRPNNQEQQTPKCLYHFVGRCHPDQ
jgi:hypothetical protein